MNPIRWLLLPANSRRALVLLFDAEGKKWKSVHTYLYHTFNVNFLCVTVKTYWHQAHPDGRKQPEGEEDGGEGSLWWVSCCSLFLTVTDSHGREKSMAGLLWCMLRFRTGRSCVGGSLKLTFLFPESHRGGPSPSWFDSFVSKKVAVFCGQPWFHGSDGCAPTSGFRLYGWSSWSTSSRWTFGLSSAIFL